MLAVVVIGLLAGLVGMHHLTVAAEPSTAVTASSPTSDPHVPSDESGSSRDGEGHDSGLFHLCLAILTVFAVFVASASALWQRQHPVTMAGRAPAFWSGTTPRAPPPTAPARLALLCVLRT